jgi:hypothetical protein
MRKRKRDWPITVYKFWARLLQLPQSMWDIANAMETLWNALVRLYDDAQFALETLSEADPREIRENADAAAVAMVGGSGLNWEWAQKSWTASVLAEHVLYAPLSIA